MRLLAPIFAVFAATASAEEVTTFSLDNGMDVVVIEDHRAPVVVHMVWYRVGSADEPVGASGVAHFLEHLLFKQTDKLEAGEFSATVAANGGSDNAFTSYDYTAYFQRVAANNAGALANEQFRAALYQNHRYGVPVIGWKHEMEQLELEDALDFYDLYYSPNNAILVVAGDVEPDAVKALAETYYGVIPAEPNLPERIRPEEPPQRAERRITFVDPRVSQPYLTRSYLAPERDSGAQVEAASLLYLAELLGGSPFTSALGTALQFDTQTAVYSNAGYSGNALDDTSFGLTVVPAQGVTLSEAEAAMDQVLADFMAEEIDPEALERIRGQLRASEIYAKDNVQGLARRYGAALTQGLTIEDVQAWPDILQAVTAEDIKAVAKKVLNRDQAVTGWVVANQEEAR